MGGPHVRLAMIMALAVGAVACGGVYAGGTDGGAGATGGSGGTSSGGTSSGGTSSGGTSSGGTSSGGTSSGGTGGSIQCSVSPQDSQCDKCLHTTCCAQFQACLANLYCPTEFKCIVGCIQGVVGDAGVATDTDKMTCASACVDPASSSGAIDPTTNELFGCANNPAPKAGTSCVVSCFGG